MVHSNATDVSPKSFPKAVVETTFQDSIFQRVFDAFIIFIFTIWVVFAWFKRPDDVLLPTAIYFMVLAMVITKRVSNDVMIQPFTIVLNPIVNVMQQFSDRMWALTFGGITLTIFALAIAFQPESDKGSTIDRLRSFLGLVTTIFVVFLLSKHRSKVDFRLVAVGLLAQAILGLFVLKTEFGKNMFSGLAKFVSDFLGLAKTKGLAFLSPEAVELRNFIVSVLPAIVFFAAFIQVMYFLGAMQWLVVKFAWVMVRVMGTSGSESVVAAASPFVGMGESAMLVLPFLEFMTESEIFTIMTSGFSTISGSVLFSFLDMGIDGSILITACIMSVPCSLSLSKLSFPETEQSLTKGEVSIPHSDQREANVLHAAANGAAQGMTLSGLIFGSLLAIVALFAFVDNIFIKFTSYFYASTSVDKELVINIAMVLGYVFWPLAWLLGVPFEDCIKVGRLLGTKMVVNEFVAFSQLSSMTGKDGSEREISLRGELLASMALAGFANIASIGISIGCLGAMAPSRRGTIATLAVPAMMIGFLCTYCSACIAGILL